MNQTNHSTSTNRTEISFQSFSEMRETHSELLEQHDQQGDTPHFLDEMERFLKQGQATGVLLDTYEDRRIAQRLLGYWTNALYRAGRETSEAILAEFDPTLAPELSNDLCPYLGLDAFEEEHRAYFFGRDQMIGRLVDHLKENITTLS